MINPSGRPRPNASGFGTFQPQRPVVAPQTTVSQTNSSIQAQYKPDFLASKPQADATQQPPAPTPITSSYQQAREALASPMPTGPMTEKQARDLNWRQRQDPIGFKEEMIRNQQIYGTPTQQTPRSAQSRPANFNGPSKRFGA